MNVGKKFPKKLSDVTPKEASFLSFGKGSLCGFKSHILFDVKGQNGTKLSRLFNFGLPEKANSSLNKDDYNKTRDRTKQSVPLTDIFLNEIDSRKKSICVRKNQIKVSIENLITKNQSLTQLVDTKAAIIFINQCWYIFTQYK